MMVVLGLFLGAPARDHADRIDADIVAVLTAEILRLFYRSGGFLGRDTRCLQEERVAVFHGEGASGGRSPGIHDQRPRATDRPRLAPNASELEILSFEVEILLWRPDHLHDVEPLLRILIARFVLALFDAKHFEFALVPADDEIQS